MKMKFGAIVVAGSGKINGMVASKNRGGAYLRTKVTPSNPQTASQQAQRALLGGLSTQWGLLTDAQRQSFNDAVGTFAKTDIFGDVRNPSGFNLFVKLNTNCVNGGFAQITSAPIKEEIIFSALQFVIINASAGTISATFLNSDLNGKKVILSATPTVGNGVSFVKNRLRSIGAVSVVGTNTTVSTGYFDKFGTPEVGANITVSVRVVTETGQLGTPQTIKATIVAE